MTRDFSEGDFVRKLLKNHQRGIICFGEVFQQIVSRANRAREIFAHLPADIVGRIKSYLGEQPHSDEDWQADVNDWVEYLSRFYKGDEDSPDFSSWREALAEERREQMARFRGNLDVLRRFFDAAGNKTGQQQRRL